jgi:SAM-dependent methyltransferase
MSVGNESYRTTAKYYDAAYAATQDLVDAPFYVGLASKHGGPVLEIGCGTGRVLLPIAREGVEIHGVDNSPAMLDVLKTRIENEPPEVRRRVVLHQRDMREFRLSGKYPLVIMPFRPLQHMHSVEDQVRALTTAAFHLQDVGIFAFDVFYPKFDLIAKGVGEEVLELEWPADSGGNKSGGTKIVRRYIRKESVDKIRQMFQFTFIFRTYEGDKLVREETEPFALSYFTHPHLRALFRLARLEVVEEYGSFARAPLDNDAKEMIFLLRRTNP